MTLSTCQCELLLSHYSSATTVQNPRDGLFSHGQLYAMKSAVVFVFIVCLAHSAVGGGGIHSHPGPQGLEADATVEDLHRWSNRLHHQPNCKVDCHICEMMAEPKLRGIHWTCPGCDCARRLVNHTVPCPAVHSGRFCVQGIAKDSRGCPTQHCAATHVQLGELLANLRSCAKVCADGYHLDPKSGLPMCSCVCPIEEVAPRYRWEYCSKQCGGKRFRMVHNLASGCQECLCEKPQHLACPAFTCHHYCPNGYVLDTRGCPKCECRSSVACPPPPAHCENVCGPEGRLRDPVTGCVTSCQCQPPNIISKACPVVGCNVDCGPHPMVTVQRDGCVTGCSCRCKVPTDCPRDELHPGICVERVRDHYGCPTCKCARRMEVSLPSNELQTGVSLCPEIASEKLSTPADVCPNKCDTQRFFDGERKCKLCDCCPNFRKECPDMFCEQYQVDHWGCSICACAPARKVNH